MAMDTSSVQSGWSKDNIALVTGANKGIGLQIVRELAKKGLTVILTSRNEEYGKAAVKELQREGLHVVYHQLDIASPESISELIQWLSQTYGAIDILVNNAGTSATPGSLDLEVAKRVIDTNFYGSKRMIEAVMPIMKHGGRIVNVSSKAGDLDYLKNEWKSKLEDISNITPQTIDSFIKEYLDAVERYEIPAKGWPCLGEVWGFAPEYASDYSTSKIALNAYSRLVAKDLQDKGISINCMCPGATATNMSRFIGHPVEMGADTAVWLALLPKGAGLDPTGKFFMNRTDVGFSGQKLFYNGRFIDANEFKGDARRDARKED